MNTCEFHVPGNVACAKPAFEKYLGLWACPGCIKDFTEMWQKVGQLGIPVRSLAPDGEVPKTIADEIKKGKDDADFLKDMHIEPL
jgi:hypothetical protein